MQEGQRDADFWERLIHDIRSPALKLKAILNGPEFSKKEASMLIGDLLSLCDQELKKTDNVELFNPLLLVRDICRRSVYTNAGVILDELCSRAILVEGPILHFKRAIVNVLDNAVEALAHHPDPKIMVSYVLKKGFLCLWIEDNGTGVVSHAREAGRGHGLASASASMKLLKGCLAIESRPIGIRVELYIPLTECQVDQVILIDDDPFFHKLWQKSALKNDIDLLCFSKLSEFENYFDQLSKDVPVFVDRFLQDDLPETSEYLLKRGMRRVYSISALEKNSKFPPWERGMRSY